MANNFSNQFKKYDSRYDFDVSMYDHLPYDRDEDLCNISSVKLESGNLIKYWRCKSKDSIPIVNKESLIEEDKIEDKISELCDSTGNRQDAVKKLINMATNGN